MTTRQVKPLCHMTRLNTEGGEAAGMVNETTRITRHRSTSITADRTSRGGRRWRVRAKGANAISSGKEWAQRLLQNRLRGSPITPRVAMEGWRGQPSGLKDLSADVWPSEKVDRLSLHGVAMGRMGGHCLTLPTASRSP